MTSCTHVDIGKHTDLRKEKHEAMVELYVGVRSQVL